MIPDPMTPDQILKWIDKPLHPILSDLWHYGISASCIDDRVAELINKPVTDASVSITRMNLIGGLRAAGYVVSGGRAGGQTYQILGWSPKESRPTIDMWKGPSREMYDWVHTRRQVTAELLPTIRQALSLRDSTEWLHENSEAYVYCYEAARDLGFFVDDESTKAVILQRHRNVPRFRIFNLYGSPAVLIELARNLAVASTHPVSIINVPKDDLKTYKNIDSRGSIGKRVEAIYDVKDIAEHPDNYLNSRAMTTLRKMERECKYYICPDEDEMLQVIETWKALNEHKHRQLAIERDRKAVRTRFDGRIVFGGSRDGHPVLHHLFAPLANAPQVVMLCNEKSLNYKHFDDGREVPGGTYGLSDYNQVMACRFLTEMGVTHIQSGGIDGGGAGLPDKKRKYACQMTESYTFYTSFEPGAPK